MFRTIQKRGLRVHTPKRNDIQQKENKHKRETQKMNWQNPVGKVSYVCFIYCMRNKPKVYT